MKVIVTGGSGFTGLHVVRDLVEHGYDVLSVDRNAPGNPICPYRLANLEDLGQVYGCLQDAEAIVHLAAIPRPIYDTPEVVFRTNMLAHFNILQAAEVLGIRRIVYASSVSYLGFPFYVQPFSPRYAPIDEAHPGLPQDAYGLSKFLGEEMAKAFVRRGYGLQVISLRFPWIHSPQTFREQLAPLWDRPQEGASNLWSYVDGRDAAQACRLVLEADLELLTDQARAAEAVDPAVLGHHPFFIAAPDSFMKLPTAELVHRYFPETEIRAELNGRWSMLDSSKAGKYLGYQAQHTWESYY